MSDPKRKKASADLVTYIDQEQARLLARARRSIGQARHALDDIERSLDRVEKDEGEFSGGETRNIGAPIADLAEALATVNALRSTRGFAGDER